MSATTEAVEANDTSTAKPSIGRRDIYTLLCFCQTTNPERGYEPPGRAQIPTNIINMIIRLIEPSSDSGKDRRARLEPRSLLQAHCSLQLTNRPTNSDIKQRIIVRISFSQNEARSNFKFDERKRFSQRYPSPWGTWEKLAEQQMSDFSGRARLARPELFQKHRSAAAISRIRTGRSERTGCASDNRCAHRHRFFSHTETPCRHRRPGMGCRED